MTCLAAPEEFFSGRSAGPPSPNPADLWRQVERVVSLTLAVPINELRASTRRGVDAACARQVAMYVAHAALGMRYHAIGRLCGRDHKTVVHACRIVEQRRDDPAFDRMLHVLEALCRDMAGDAPQMPRGRA